MKKLMFLTMVFGLMVVFNGSVLAQERNQERPGTIGPNCVGKSPRVGDQVIVNPKTGIVGFYSRDKRGDSVTPWYELCSLTIKIDSVFRQRYGEETYWAKVNLVNYSGTSYVIRKGDIVGWSPAWDGDVFTFKTADGKNEVGKVATVLNIPNPKR